MPEIVRFIYEMYFQHSSQQSVLYIILFDSYRWEATLHTAPPVSCSRW